MLAALLLFALLAIILRRFPPDHVELYRCPFLALTGWRCPGCGMTRALAALLRGDWAGSWRWNPLCLPLLAGVLWYGLVRYRRLIAGVPTGRLAIPGAPLALLIAAMAAFTLARNL